MSRYRRRRYRRERGLTEEEKIGWILAAVVFVIAFLFYFVYGFFAHCVFVWPPRWDTATCWNEQIQPAKDNAAEKAAHFIP